MEFLIRWSSLFLVVVTICLNIQFTIETFYDLGKNTGDFERLTCTTYPGSKVSNVHCRVKYIDRKHLSVDTWANLTQPINGAWVHAIAYYKYNTYQKIATEYWDDLCGWKSGKSKSYFLDLYRSVIQKYTNFNHTCPYSGLVYFGFRNISLKELTFPPIIPAGRYRVDINFTEGDRKTALVGSSLFVSISDHRLEIV